VTGSLLHVTDADTSAVSGRWVVLHAVTLDGGGPVDSVRTDRNGEFTMVPARLDTLASYLVSAEHQGIGYFSDPFRPVSGEVHTVSPVVVFDTSSSTPAIELHERHVLVRAAAADGTRQIIELFVLANRGTKTRIAPSAAQPVWRGSIPDDAMQFEIGLSDMSEEAITRVGKTIQVAAPIPPGEREMLVRYLLPRGLKELRVPVDQPVGHLAVLLGDSTATIASELLTLVGVEDLEGTPLRRYEAQGVPSGSSVLVQLRVRPVGRSVFLWLVVPVVAAAFVVAFLRWRRMQSMQPATSTSGDPTALAAEIAALDAAFAGREDDDYRTRRAELKGKLAALLRERG
jgi:hypothetical protein